jgi:HK97 family phage major capsid protein/HK97 family phage prohead protease
MSDEQNRAESTVTRSFAIKRVEDDGKKVYRASLSSEEPVRDFPWQPPMILRHNAKSVDLSRAGENGLPLLTSHARHDIDSIIGRIKNVRLERKRLIGDIHFSEVSERAKAIRALVDEGTITDMSIGANIDRTRFVQDDDEEVIEAIRWTPFEASVVTVGADGGVGIGRNRKAAQAAEDDAMTGKAQSAADDVAEKDDKIEGKSIERRIEAGRHDYDSQLAVRNEEKRVEAIRALGEANAVGDDTVHEWITRGYSLDQVADNILAIHKKRGETNQAKTHLGLTEKETKEYSLCRAILAAHSDNWKDAGFELECHKAVAVRTNKIPERGSFFVPLDVQRRQTPVNMRGVATRHGLGYLQRDLTAGGAGTGAEMVQTSNLGFDELLRNISFAFRMGVQRLSGLRDNVAIPRQTAAATAAWLATEATPIGESDQTFTQLALTPRTVGAYTELSRQLLLQATIDAEGLVNSDLAAVVALAVDAALLNGSGASGQPEGLDNTAGIGAVTGTSLGFAGVLNFQEDVAAANVMPISGGYVTTPAVASLMIQRVKYTSTASPLWEGNLWTGNMVGFPAMSTNQVAAGTMYFGDWAKAVIAEWGVLEVETNPYANFPAGIIGVRAMYSVDVGIRYPAAFSRAITIT